MLSVYSQGDLYTSSLAYTLNHSTEYLSTETPSISRTPIELHCTVSDLSDQAMFPKIVQILRLPSRQFAMHNIGIILADFHLEKRRSFPRIYLSLRFLQAYPSSLPLVIQRVLIGQWPRAALITKIMQKMSACMLELPEEIMQTRGTRTRYLTLHCL